MFMRIQGILVLDNGGATVYTNQVTKSRNVILQCLICIISVWIHCHIFQYIIAKHCR